MKKLVTISLFIFWAVVTATLTAGIIFYQNNKINNLGNSNNNQILGQEQVNKTVSQVTLNLIEVAKHNLASDCWTIVRGKVYNVTSFASLHSGGNTAVLYNCGKDGTTSYDTKDGNGSHQVGDINILANYYIGDLNKTITQQDIQQNIQKSNSVNNQNFNKKENEDEYEDD
jgi:cytochrome b involved in lipid metabolism